MLFRRIHRLVLLTLMVVGVVSYVSSAVTMWELIVQTSDESQGLVGMAWGTSSVTNRPDYGVFFNEGRSVTLSAQPKTGYHFVRWQDNVTSNPRTVVTGTTAMTYTAYFAINTYTLTVNSANTSMGTVSGGGTYNHGATATLTATPKSCYLFKRWTDGNTDNPRSVTVTSAGTYTAEFATEVSGTCGTNVQWSYNGCTHVLTISGTGAMADFVADADCPWYQYRTQIYTINIDEGVTTIGAKAFVFSRISSITIPNSVTSIGRYAFCYSNYLEEIVLPEGLISIGDHAFYYGNVLKTVHIPSSATSLGVSAFEGCSLLKDIYVEWQSSVPEWPSKFSKTYGVNLHVPCGKESIYEEAPGWQDYNIVADGQITVTVQTATGDTSQGTVSITALP